MGRGEDGNGGDARAAEAAGGPADVGGSEDTRDVSLVRVGPQDFDEVYEALLRDMDPDRPREEWRRIFEPGWPRQEEHCGLALRADGRLVGFLGLLFTEMHVDGKPERLCNVTTWVVRPEHAAEASWLLFPLREMDGYTLTNLTPDASTFEAFTRFGFEVLETHVRTFLPPLLSGLPGRDRPGVLLDPDAIAPELTEGDLRILRHHRPYARHALVSDEDGYGYFVYTVVRRHRLRRANLHYVSDRSRLAAHLPSLQRALRRKEGLWLVESDERVVRGLDGLPWSFRQRLDTPELYRSERLTPERIPTLYSELPLLGLRV